METILFENEDIEDDDFIICNRSLVKSLSLTISSTAGAVAALGKQKGSCSDASTRKKNSEKAKKTDLKNLTTQAEVCFYLQLNDFEFKNNFLMTRKTFEALCCQIYKDVKSQEMPVEKQLGLTLWILGTQGNLLPVAERFNTNINSLMTIFISTCRVLCKLSSQVICWPENNELSYIAESFKDKTGLPGIIGAIGTTNITARNSDQKNNIGQVSVCLQAVCDFKLRFININIDSSVLDHRSFSACGPFYRFLVGNLLRKNFYVVGDVDFPLLPSLLTPFTNNEQLPFQAELFNKYHSLARTYIYKTFALLEQKFKRLKSLDQYLIGELQTVITASCVLHNFILQTEVDCVDTLTAIEHRIPALDTGIRKSMQNQMWIYSDNDQLEDRMKIEATDCLTSYTFKQNTVYKQLELEGSSKRMEVAMSL